MFSGKRRDAGVKMGCGDSPPMGLRELQGEKDLGGVSVWKRLYNSGEVRVDPFQWRKEPRVFRFSQIGGRKNEPDTSHLVISRFPRKKGSLGVTNERRREIIGGID